MNPAVAYIEPFLRRYRLTFRVDTWLHAIFLPPALLALYRITRWRDVDLVVYAVVVAATCTAVFLAGLHTNRSILRLGARGMVLPVLSSLLWIIAFPLVAVFGVHVLQDRLLPGFAPVGIWESASVFIKPAWTFILFGMIAYKGLYLTSVHQHGIWSERIETLT